MHVNSPLENSPVNSGDQLNFTATIGPLANDGLIDDNTFTLQQIVVNAFDPNEKTCLEGNAVSPTEIGDYLHYAINFENTGTAAAQNIVVRDVIDSSKFDIASLQMMRASHPAQVRIAGDKIEFVFENIQLQPNELGNVVFKIKTKSTLEANDSVSNKADIFFDYNFPVSTNTATTTFQLLAAAEFTSDESIGIYPNPANDFIMVNAIANMSSIQLFDVQGRIIQTMLNQGTQSKVDISKCVSGVYFLKILTVDGKKVEKLVKN